MPSRGHARGRTYGRGWNGQKSCPLRALRRIRALSIADCASRRCQIAGAAGTVVSLSKTVGQMSKFVQLGGCVQVSRLCGYQTHPAAIRSVLELIMAMAAVSLAGLPRLPFPAFSSSIVVDFPRDDVLQEEDDFRKMLMHEGAVRATLNLLDESRKVPTRICEVFCHGLLSLPNCCPQFHGERVVFDCLISSPSMMVYVYPDAQCSWLLILHRHQSVCVRLPDYSFGSPRCSSRARR